MITHFVAMDFRSNRIFWIITLLITAITAPLIYFNHEAIMLLFYCYLFLLMAPMNSLVGSRWRSQHVMSRHYLLSLPIARNKLFQFIQVRAAVFQIPMILLAAYLAFVDPNIVLSFELNVRIVFFAAVVCSASWFVNFAIAQGIAFESIGTYQRRAKRVRLWLLLFGRLAVELLFVAGVFYLLKHVADSVAMSGALVAIIFIAALRYKSAREAWLGLN